MSDNSHWIYILTNIQNFKILPLQKPWLKKVTSTIIEFFHYFITFNGRVGSKVIKKTTYNGPIDVAPNERHFSAVSFTVIVGWLHIII